MGCGGAVDDHRSWAVEDRETRAVLRGQRDLRRLIPTRREGTGEKSSVGQGKQIGKYKKKSVLKLRNA